MEKKQYTMPLIEVIALGTERIMATDSISNIAPNDNFFNHSTFLMGDTYYILKELQIESFGGRNVFHIVHFADFTNDSVQWYIRSVPRRKTSRPCSQYSRAAGAAFRAPRLRQ